jgi:hypothetical protein
VKPLSTAFLTATAIAQSPPFTMFEGVATSPWLGYVAAVQYGNTSVAVNSAAWCEQLVHAYAPAGTPAQIPSFGWEPTVGHQIVLATEGLRCQPFPPFQPYFQAGSYVPIFGVSFTNFGLPAYVPGGAAFWDELWLDAPSASFFLPPYQRTDPWTGPPHDIFYATIDVPNDPQLVGTVLWVQSFRPDPLNGWIYASRTLGLWLQP